MGSGINFDFASPDYLCMSWLCFIAVKVRVARGRANRSAAGVKPSGRQISQRMAILVLAD